jgi:hypothetical protein
METFIDITFRSQFPTQQSSTWKNKNLGDGLLCCSQYYYPDLGYIGRRTSDPLRIRGGNLDYFIGIAWAVMLIRPSFHRKNG